MKTAVDPLVRVLPFHNNEEEGEDNTSSHKAEEGVHFSKIEERRVPNARGRTIDVIIGGTRGKTLGGRGRGTFGTSVMDTEEDMSDDHPVFGASSPIAAFTQEVPMTPTSPPVFGAQKDTSRAGRGTTFGGATRVSVFGKPDQPVGQSFFGFQPQQVEPEPKWSTSHPVFQEEEAPPVSVAPEKSTRGKGVIRARGRGQHSAPRGRGDHTISRGRGDTIVRGRGQKRDMFTKKKEQHKETMEGDTVDATGESKARYAEIVQGLRDQNKTIFVKCTSDDINEDYLVEVYSAVGEVESIEAKSEMNAFFVTFTNHVMPIYQIWN